MTKRFPEISMSRQTSVKHPGSEQALARHQVQQVDRQAVAQYGFDGRVLMENAGRGCVALLGRLGIRGRVVVCCGAGNNGGDGFVIARHLAIRAIPTRVLLCCDPQRLRGDAESNYQILTRCGVEIQHVDQWRDDQWSHAIRDAGWLVDALLGTGSQGEPRPPFDQAIRCLNESPARRLAVDVPSGLDCDQGQPASLTFRADHTCTFVASKIGFSSAAARPFLGEVHVADIGVPWKIVQEILDSLADPRE